MMVCESDRGSRHEKIVHDEGRCPLCEALALVSELTGERDAAQEKWDDHKCPELQGDQS